MARPGLEGGVILGEGVGQAVQGLQDISQVEQGLGMIGLAVQDAAEGGFGLRELARDLQQDAEVEARARMARIGLQDGAVGGLGRVPLAHVGQHIASVHQRLAVIGVEGQGRVEQGQGLGPVAQVKGGDAGDVEGVRVVGGGHQGVAPGGQRLAPVALGQSPAAGVQQGIDGRRGEAGKSRRGGGLWRLASLRDRGGRGRALALFRRPRIGPPLLLFHFGVSGSGPWTGGVGGGTTISGTVTPGVSFWPHSMDLRTFWNSPGRRARSSGLAAAHSAIQAARVRKQNAVNSLPPSGATRVSNQWRRGASPVRNRRRSRTPATAARTRMTTSFQPFSMC